MRIALVPMRAVVAAALLMLAGCGAQVYAEPAYSETAYLPSEAELHTHALYRGRDVYWFDGHWWFRSGPRWAYYRHEPPELVQLRIRVYPRPVPHAHRDPRERFARDRPDSPREVERRSAPPAVRVAPRISAPPARISAPPARRHAPPARKSAPPARKSAPPAHGRTDEHDG